MTADRKLLAAFAALTLGCAADAAHAQVRGESIAAGPVSYNFARDRNTSVRQRPRPDYEALGGQVGGFTVFPQVNATVERNDNIYAAASNATADTVYLLQPEVSISTDWSRHALNLYARSALTRYDDNASEDSDAWAIGGSGRLDILRTQNLSGNFELSRSTEPRTNISSQIGSVVPIQYYQRQADLAFMRELNRVRISARAEWRDFDYRDGRAFDGASVDQDDRDRAEFRIAARGEYAISPATAAFLQVAGDRHDYDLSDAEVGLSRDSDGVEVLAGANFELSSLIRGEIGVGYERQSYKNPAFRDIGGFSARAQLEWFPTELTTVSLTGSRRIYDSGIPGSAGYVSTYLASQIDHELLRNLIVTGRLAYGRDVYKDLDRRDVVWRAGVAGTYLVNRNVGVTLDYSYYDLSSSGVDGGGGYSINKVGATMTLQY